MDVMFGILKFRPGAIHNTATATIARDASSLRLRFKDICEATYTIYPPCSRAKPFKFFGPAPMLAHSANLSDVRRS